NVQDRSGATFQTYPIPTPEANPSSRTHTEIEDHPIPIFSALKSNQKQALNWGVGRYLSASAAATQKTIPAHTPHRKSRLYVR
ncbi:hypothetical protein, partial [Paenarthrobacter sp. 22069]|uniref:hypothetical protein n=1 Tax=Paenarthrobacter sp. 22069 TaxID=3453864 RepID=UPI003F82A22B